MPWGVDIRSVRWVYKALFIACLYSQMLRLEQYFIYYTLHSIQCAIYIHTYYLYTRLYCNHYYGFFHYYLMICLYCSLCRYVHAIYCIHFTYFTYYVCIMQVSLSLRNVGVVCAIFTTVRDVNSSVRTFIRCVLTETPVCPKFLMDRQFFRSFVWTVEWSWFICCLRHLL